MSDFVEFLASDYQRAGNVFAGFTPTRDFNLKNALAMMWFAQLTYEVDDSGGNKNATKIAWSRINGNSSRSRHFENRPLRLENLSTPPGSSASGTMQS